MFEIGSSNLMQKTLDALWMRQRVISNNIANIDTPGYKAKELKFEDYLQDLLNPGNDGKIPEPKIITKDSTEIREDGNNVNIDVENVELYRVQIQYDYMVRKISDEFAKYRMVLTDGKG